MMKIELPFWLGGPEIKKLALGAENFWARFQSAYKLSLERHDLDHCDLEIVDLVAVERGVERFAGEREALYRSRVRDAYLNALDAGSTSGFYRIFQRLGIDVLSINERIPGQDWDIIQIELDDTFNEQSLLNVIVRSYGMTCRRYQLAISHQYQQQLRVGAMNWQHSIQ